MFKRILWSIYFLLIITSPALSQIQVQNGGTVLGNVNKLNCSTNTTCTKSGSTATITASVTGSGSGTVGIGTTNYVPVYVGVNTTGPSSIIVVGNNVGISTTSTSNILSVGGGIAVGTATYTSETAPANGMIIEGNVGIGTLSPSYALSVVGQIYATGGFAGNSATTTAFANTPTLCNDGEYFKGIDTGGNSLGCVSLSAGAGGWTDGGTNVYVSQTTDNVGIGTTFPSAQIEVVKNAGQSLFMASSSATADGDFFIIKSAGNVGIGSTTPEYKLVVDGTISATGYVGIGTTAGIVKLTEASANGSNFIAIASPSSLAGDTTWIFPSADGSGCFQSDGAGNVTIGACGSSGGFTDGGTNVYVTTTTDNLGIGTTFPSAQVELVKNAGQALLMLSSVATGDGDYVKVDSTGNIGLGSTTPRGRLDLSTGIIYGDGSGLINLPANGWTDSGTNVYNTTITDNVGIGTTFPSGQIEIVKNAAQAPLMVSSVASANGDYLIITSVGNIGIGTTLPASKVQINSSDTAGIMISSTATGSGDLFIVDSTGNVGIGSTVPITKFDLRASGGFRATGIGTTVPQQLCHDGTGRIGYFNGAWAGSCTVP